MSLGGCGQGDRLCCHVGLTLQLLQEEYMGGEEGGRGGGEEGRRGGREEGRRRGRGGGEEGRRVGGEEGRRGGGEEGGTLTSKLLHLKIRMVSMPIR